MTFDEISNISINLITEEVFHRSITFLNDQIDNYLNEHQETNLINIAKSKDFTDYLLGKLNDK